MDLEQFWVLEFVGGSFSLFSEGSFQVCNRDPKPYKTNDNNNPNTTDIKIPLIAKLRLN